jgi:hypothetical protein
MVQEHTFREDLFYRINLITVHLPASWILPHAVINITGTSGRNTLTCFKRVNPSSPLVDRVKFISIKINWGATERTISIASLGPGTACTSYFALFSIKLREERMALSSSIINIILLQM